MAFPAIQWGKALRDDRGLGAVAIFPHTGVTHVHLQVANEFMANDDFCDEFQLADMRRLESCMELCKDCTCPQSDDECTISYTRFVLNGASCQAMMKSYVNAVA